MLFRFRLIFPQSSGRRLSYIERYLKSINLSSEELKRQVLQLSFMHHHILNEVHVKDLRTWCQYGRFEDKN